jgi:hypothetical protein
MAEIHEITPLMPYGTLYVLCLFIAGHGLHDGPAYRFLATNVEVAADGVLRGSTVVQWQVLQSAVEGAKGRHILFIDTCHAGNAYNPRLATPPTMPISSFCAAAVRAPAIAAPAPAANACTRVLSLSNFS